MYEQRIRPRLIQGTCAVDGRSHRVTEHAFDVGRRDGYHRALCGHTTSPARRSASPRSPLNTRPEFNDP